MKIVILKALDELWPIFAIFATFWQNMCHVSGKYEVYNFGGSERSAGGIERVYTLGDGNRVRSLVTVKITYFSTKAQSEMAS